MEPETNGPCPVSVRRYHRPQQVGDVYAGEAQSLAARHERGHHNRVDEAPEHGAPEIHPVSPLSLMPFAAASHSARVSAALMSPTWVKAWRKLPSAALV